MYILGRIRLILAIIICPLVMSAVMQYAFEIAAGADSSNSESLQSSISTAAWIVYLSTIFVATPIYLYLKRRERYSIANYYLAGALVGLLVWLLFSLLSKNMVVLLLFFFLVAGVLVGGFFWVMTLYQPSVMSSAGTRKSKRSRRR